MKALFIAVFFVTSSFAYGMDETYLQWIMPDLSLDERQPASTNDSIYLTPEEHRRRPYQALEVNGANGEGEESMIETFEERVRRKYSDFERDCADATPEELRVLAFNAIIGNELELLICVLSFRPSLIYAVNRPEGETVLHWAARTGTKQILLYVFQFVRENDCSLLTQRNNSGHMPLHILYDRDDSSLEKITNQMMEDCEQLLPDEIFSLFFIDSEMLIKEHAIIEESLKDAWSIWSGLPFKDAEGPINELAEKGEDCTLACNEEL